MWAPGSYNKLHFLRDPKTIFKYMLYVPINPVAAGLVRRAKDWPGVKVLPHEIGKRVWKIDRPDFFFDANGEMPESVVLETSLPRVRGMSAEDVRSKLIADLKERERTIQRERKSKKKGFLGAKAVLAQSPFAYPKGGEPRRCMNHTTRGVESLGSPRGHPEPEGVPRPALRRAPTLPCRRPQSRVSERHIQDARLLRGALRRPRAFVTDCAAEAQDARSRRSR